MTKEKGFWEMTKDERAELVMKEYKKSTQPEKTKPQSKGDKK